MRKRKLFSPAGWALLQPVRYPVNINGARFQILKRPFPLVEPVTTNNVEKEGGGGGHEEAK